MKARFKWHVYEEYNRSELEEVLLGKKGLQDLTLKEFQELVDSMNKREYAIVLEFDTMSKELKIVSDNTE